MSIPRVGDIDNECELCPLRLVSLIKQFQKMGQPSDALGVWVWLHSVRALNVPEIRIFGRQMWKELVRGFPFALQALQQMRDTGAILPNGIEWELSFIPHGLEPTLE